MEAAQYTFVCQADPTITILKQSSIDDLQETPMILDLATLPVEGRYNVTELIQFIGPFFDPHEGTVPQSQPYAKLNNRLQRV